jgi:hypothetical protein
MGGKERERERDRVLASSRYPISGAATSQLQIPERGNYTRRVASTMEIRQTV